jgi:glycosyltransferase involved in cell wall biosynthesis
MLSLLPVTRRSVRPAGPLRVLFVVPDLTVGGAERHVVTLLPAMDPARFAPSVLCINQEGPLFAELAATGVPARALGHPKGDPKGLLRGFGQLVAHLRRERPDVVVMRGSNAETLGRFAAMLAGVPRTVVWVHNCGTAASRPPARRLADRLLGPATSAYYGLARGQVPYLVDELGYPRDKIRLVHNGVDPATYPFVPVPQRKAALAAELGIASGEPVAGIVAAVRPEKDHATFLRAAKQVLATVPNARFLVIGRGRHDEDLERVRALADELGIAQRVVFTGRRADVGDLVALMDVFCLTSYTVECFPISLLEAMAIGRAAVCTAVGGIPDMIDDGVTGYVVPPRDPTALARRLAELLGDPARAEKMGRAARDRLEERFTLASSVREAQWAIEETAGRRVPAVGA